MTAENSFRRWTQQKPNEAGPLNSGVRQWEDDMDDAFQAKLDLCMGTFRRWAQGRDVSGCRLVQYVGVDLLGAIDVPLGEVESQIEGLVCEGFLVAWAQLGRVMYLRVWEADGPEPPWSKVFAEEPLADVEAILREAQVARRPQNAAEECAH
jgi:hypothetical protein